MYHYIKNNEYENIWNTCLRYENDDKDLWVQALTYFAGLDDPRCLDYIKRILKEIQDKKVLSPLIVLEIL